MRIEVLETGDQRQFGGDCFRPQPSTSRFPRAFKNLLGVYVIAVKAIDGWVRLERSGIKTTVDSPIGIARIVDG